jgi:hypothetical protein
VDMMYLDFVSFYIVVTSVRVDPPLYHIVYFSYICMAHDI